MTPGSIPAIFEQAGCRGWLCAIDIESGRACELGADEPVVAASVVKVPIALEFFRQVAAGRIDPAEPVTVTPGESTPGPTGISNFDDAVQMSLRDLNRMMLVISDNAATDVMLARVGREAVDATLVELGLPASLIRQNLRELVDSVGRDLGFADWESFTSTVDGSPPAEVARLRALLPGISAMDPARTNATTAREMATLMSQVWRDEAGPPAACADLRSIMATQLTRHRIASGFPFGVTVAAKSGGLLGVVRNEVGVVSYPDGGRYALAAFTRADHPFVGEHCIDAAIGAACAQAVRELRAAP